jgi:hypothetical protein
MTQVNVEIVKRSDCAKGFVVLPKRWLVERTFAWLNRCRRLAKDWECLSRKALAFLRLASIRLMLRKLCMQTMMFADRLLGRMSEDIVARRRRDLRIASGPEVQSKMALRWGKAIARIEPASGPAHG